MDATAKDFQAGIMAEIEGAQTVDFFKQYEKYFLSTTRPEKPQTPRIEAYGSIQVGTVGNITGISAEFKAGKTALVNYFLSCALTNNCFDFDGCENLTVTRNELNHALLLFDTEQDRSDQYRNLTHSILKRAGLQNEPPNLYVANIRVMTLAEKRTFTEATFKAAYEKHGGIHLAIIDGIADYVSSVNDDKESADILRFFADMAERYQTCIVLIIHVNPGSQKERGHLGSELQRKCKSLLTIKKEGDVSILEGKDFRSAKRGEFAPIQYEYDTTKGYHVFIGAGTQKPTQKELELYNTATAVFTESRTYTKAVDLITQFEAVSKPTAKRRIGELIAANMIERTGSGSDIIYRLKGYTNDSDAF